MKKFKILFALAIFVFAMGISKTFAEDVPVIDVVATSTEAAIVSNVVDVTPPTAESILINGGALFTSNRNVTLTLSATDESGVAEMNISNHTSYHGWEPYVATRENWMLADSDGLKDIHVLFKDKVGNAMATSTNISATITLDRIAPVITLNGSATTSLNVGDTYTEQGATTTDGSIVVIGGDIVDANKVGTYVVTYNATDAAGNKAVEVTRTVVVSQPPVTSNCDLDKTKKADMTGDGLIDASDTGFVSGLIVSCKGNWTSDCAKADVIGDGKVNVVNNFDVLFVRGQFGCTVPRGTSGGGPIAKSASTPAPTAGLVLGASAVNWNELSAAERLEMVASFRQQLAGIVRLFGEWKTSQL